MKINFYTQIHKALRRWLFTVSMNIATLDCHNANSRQLLYGDLSQLIALLRIHAKHEEEFFHPLIAKKIKKHSSDQLDKEHQEQEQQLEEIERVSKKLLAEQDDHVQTSLGLYQKFNLFIADYLQHLAEEEAIMVLLQQQCTVEELMQALQALMGSLTAKEIMDSLHYMLPALNPEERSAMLQALLG